MRDIYKKISASTLVHLES